MFENVDLRRELESLFTKAQFYVFFYDCRTFFLICHDNSLHIRCIEAYIHAKYHGILLTFKKTRHNVTEIIVKN